MRKTLTNTLWAIVCVAAHAQQNSGQMIQGRLESTLSRPKGMVGFRTAMPTAEQTEREHLAIPIGPSDSVWANQVGRWSGQSKKLRVAIVRRSSGDAYLAIDLDANGTYSPGEIRPMHPSDSGKDAYDLQWDFPDAAGNFASVPISFRISAAVQHAGDPVTMIVDDRVLATGDFPFHGRSVRVAFLCFPEGPTVIDLKRNRLGVDTNGDGEVDWSATSPENSVPQGRYAAASAPDSALPDPVFRVGDSYLSFVSVDVAKKTFALRERSQNDYVRIELTAGGPLPDFSFVDFSGKKRHFAEFRGKYVLLDFWGSWCAPCVHDMPMLQDIYSRMRASGLEILGIDNDDDASAADKMIAKCNCAWTNARSDKTLFSDRFAIGSWPTKVLINPQGKIVSLDRPGEPSLSVENLEKTLGAFPDFPVR